MVYQIAVLKSHSSDYRDEDLEMPATLNPVIEDKTYLRHFWHPVCTVDEFDRSNPSGNGPMAVKLLGQNLVIVRLNQELMAADDRCVHRSARLSLGSVCEHHGRDVLQCPYHGWRYDNVGACALIPACPDRPIPSRAKISKYDCATKYGIVWVRLDRSFDCTHIPHLGDWDTEGMRIVVADSYVWKTTAERRWENFTDFSHFAFVHPGTLYDPFFASHPTVAVDRTDGELRFQLAPPRAMAEKLPENAPMGDFTYRCAMPYSVNLEIKLWKDNSKFILWTTASPVDDQNCRNFMIIVRTEDHQPDQAHLDFQKLVLEEDRPVIQSQWPIELDSSELSVSTDKISIQYRKWHKELSEAALMGKEQFSDALIGEVIEPRQS